MARLEDFAAARIKDLNPDIDVRPGTANWDFLVRPHAAILGQLQLELDAIREALASPNPESLPEEQLDLIATRFFITRKAGSRSSVTVRIFLSSDAPIFVAAGTSFSSSTGETFLTIEDFSFTTAELRLNTAGELFFADVQAFSNLKDETANVPAGSIVGMDPEPAFFSGVDNPAAASGGSRKETNAELVARIRRSISLRNLITDRGISTAVTENFQDIFEAVSIGFGDPEMHRDKTLGVHTGGRVDIYVASSSGFEAKSAHFLSAVLTPESDHKIHIPISADATGQARITNTPLIRITSVEWGASNPDGSFTVEGVLTEGMQYELRVLDNPNVTAGYENAGRHFRFSVQEKMELVIDDDFARVPQDPENPNDPAQETTLSGKDLRVNYLWAPFIKPIQEFADSRLQRVVCSDILVKTFIPMFLDLNVSVRPLPSAADVDYETAIRDFINRLPTPRIFELSDIVDLLYDMGADKVDLPMTVRSTIISTDGTVILTASENEIDLSGVADPEKPVTPAIVHTHAGTVTVTVIPLESPLE